MKLFGNRLQKIITNEYGGVLIIVAFLIVALLGITALAVDVGELYSVRRQMVNAADAAALAGAQELIRSPGDHSKAEIVAREYAHSHNQSDAGQVEVTIPNDYTVEVITGKNVQYTFARILGFTDSDVPAQATAVTGKIIEMEGLIPIGMHEQMFYDLVGEGGIPFVNFHETYGPGNWSWVDFDPPPVTKFVTVDILENGYPGELAINQTIWTNTGANIVAGNTKQSVANILDYYIENETVLFMPITENPPGSMQGREAVKIVGFAAIIIEDYYLGPPTSSQSIIGKIVSGQVGAGTIIPGQGSVYEPKGVALID